MVVALTAVAVVAVVAAALVAVAEMAVAGREDKAVALVGASLATAADTDAWPDRHRCKTHCTREHAHKGNMGETAGLLGSF